MRTLGVLLLVASVLMWGCVGSRTARVQMAAQAEPRAGEQALLLGEAREAKGGAVLVLEGGEPVYVRGLSSWPAALAGQRLEVVGTLARRELLPPSEMGDGGAQRTGAEGLQSVLEGAPDWKRGLGRVVVVTGVARSAKAGPVIVTAQGPLYVHAAGERWPDSVEGRAVTGVGRLLRKKRPSTPENDDSELGGRTELTEEWALEPGHWSLGPDAGAR